MQLLAVGDLHLGRRPGRLPDAVLNRLGEQALGPGGALDRLVAAAIRERVDVVVFTGDVVDQDDDFFEAFAQLRRAVARLVEAGIRVVGVAGNHDVRVLPQLVQDVPGFLLLGADGTWEHVTLTAGSGVTIELHGWSFPGPRVTTSPLAGVAIRPEARPALGLLHCDRDQHGSDHAPVASRELADAGLDAWLLGHIHKPDALSPTNPGGYLGSVTALRASETGARGPWHYQIDHGGIHSVTHWPLAPLRWEAVDIDISNLERADDIRPRIINAAQAAASTLAGDRFRPDVLGLRLRLHGRTRLSRQIENLLTADELGDLPLDGGIQGFVGRWWLDTRPTVDLDALARQSNPAGLLARRLLLLDQAPDSDPERQALIERARRHLSTVRRDAAWTPIDPSDPSDAAIADWLRRGAVAALDELLSQQQDEEESA